MKKAIAPTSRFGWLNSLAQSKGYTIERDDGGRYVLERDGLSRRYSFAACLEALNTGKNLPENMSRVREPELVLEEKPEPVVEAQGPLTGFTLTPGGSMNGGGWWLSDGKVAMWKPTSAEATAAAESGELARKVLQRSGDH